MKEQKQKHAEGIIVRPFTGAAVVAGTLPLRMRLTGKAQEYMGFRV